MNPARALRGLAMLLALALAATLAWRTQTGHDFGFHLATGQYILGHHAWPRTDPFTYTVADHPYITMHGLFQVAMALAFGAGGYLGLGLLREGLVLATVLLVWLTARRRGVHSPALLLAGLSVALLAWEFRWFMRPELATTLCLAAQLYLLGRHAESGRRAWLYLCAPLQLVWVNSHALSLFGIAVLGLYALAGLAGPRRRDAAPWIALALAAGAMFLNPYGAAGVRFLWELRSRLESGNAFASGIQELASPFRLAVPGTGGFLAYKFLLLAGLALAALRANRLGLFPLALVAVFGWLSATASRNIGLFAVAALPVFLDAAQQLLDGAGKRSASLAAFGACALGVIALLAAVGSGGYYGVRPERFGSAPCESELPVATTAMLLEEAPPGPLFNTLDVGGYLEGALWRREKTFIDGRLEVMGEEFFEEYRGIVDGPGWSAMLGRYNPNLALVPYTSGELLKRLLRDPEWAPLEMDGNAALLIRNQASNQRWLEAAIARWTRANAPIRTDEAPILPRPRPGPALRFLRGDRVPMEWIARGDALAVFGLERAAWRSYREALALWDAPDQELVKKYSALCGRLGRAQEEAYWHMELKSAAMP